jgi:peptidoglycan/xylan/chitin deacetylase (PgdA/CDA1 family)
MVNIRSRRRAVRGKSKLVLYLEMKDAVERVLASGPGSFSRASAGCEYWRRPAVSAGADMSRHRKGLLAECEDTNVLVKNAGNDQAEVETYWDGFLTGCLRAFNFEDNCDDELGHENLSVTDVTYTDGQTGYGRAAQFAVSTADLNLGCPTDVGNKHTFAIAAWIYTSSATRQIILWKTKKYFELLQSGSVVVLHGAVQCATSWAGSTSSTTMSLNAWHHVAMTYSSTTKTIKLYIDGSEVSYSNQTVGVGDEVSESSYYAHVGAFGDGSHYVIQGYMDAFRWYETELSGSEISALYGSGDMVVASREQYAKTSGPMVTFTFDDGNGTDYTKAFPLFSSKGVRGTSFIITNNIGVGGLLTASQLQEMQQAGWEIGSHTKSHRNLTTLSEEELIEELQGSREALEALGVSVRTLAYPGGAQNDTVREHTNDYYEAARIVTHYGHTSTMGTYALKAYDADDHTKLADYKANVDDAEANNLWVIFFMHQLSNDDVAMLDELIDYIQAKSIPVVTMAEGYDRCGCGVAYDGDYIRLSAAGSARLFYQTQTLTAEEYVISFLAYTDGSPVTSSEVVAFADTAFTNEVTDTNYEHLGGGVYLCWGTFTATAADWNVGVEVKENKTVHISVLTCIKAGTSTASGPYPRSPIPNDTAGAAARKADSLTVAGSSNFHPDQGTLDIEFYPLYPSDLSSSFQFCFAHLYGGDGQMSLRKGDADTIAFRIQANGDDDSVVATISWSRGDRIRVRVVWNCDEKLDGTNYMLIYGRVNDGAWSQIGTCSTQPTAPSSDQTLYVGRAGDSPGYEGNSFISWLRIYDRPLLNPGW